MERKPTILYVDDESINLELFEIVFRKKYEILTAISGHDGIEALKQNSGIQVIISDMKMPGMNGIEFIKKVKEIHPEIPCFILTGYKITNEIIEALKEKIIEEHLIKPFDISEIESALEKVL
jgi:two-component system response regulator (stage 0 sporulation protein F)